MSRRTNTASDGFTLLELVVALGIFGSIGIVIVGTLYTVLVIRSKQQSIETSSHAARAVLTTVTNAILVAKHVSVPSSDTVRITGEQCRTIRKNGSNLEQAVDISPTCTPPTSGFVVFTPDGVSVTAFAVVMTGSDAVQISFSGTYIDAFGSHDFNYQTSATPRVTL